VMIALQLGVHVGPYVLAVMGVGRLLIAATITPLESWGLVTVGLISLTRLILFRAFRYRLDNALLGEVPMALGWSYILARSTWYVGVRKQLAWRGRHYGSSTRYGLD
jgi:hypothetical protein